MSPVVIIHYHLRIGGVSSVIQSQINALQRSQRDCLILCSEEPEVECNAAYAILPNLKYLKGSTTHYRDSFNLYKECLTQAFLHFGEQDPIWLIHNPTLGKNALLPIFISFLARDRRALILQCHDFAEDGRPKNYQNIPDHHKLYPIAENVHYAFINQRDLTYFRKAGLAPEQSHLLENCITEKSIHRAPLSETLVLYPVRGIRRKNLGELLLWSMLAPDNTTFALTLEPKESQWTPYYSLWATLAEEMQLPVVFGCIEACSGSTFSDWLASATHCITTSISEGFGMSFIEPLSFNIPLIGRDLPDITTNFQQRNCLSNQLYQSIQIPVEWIDQEELKQHIQTSLQSSSFHYNLSYAPDQADKVLETLITSDHVDFGNLPEHVQVDILYKIHKGNNRNQVRIINQQKESCLAEYWIENALKPRPPLCATNLSHYSAESYHQRFESLLETVENSPRHSPYWLHPKLILKQYSQLKNFHFLQSF